MINFPHRCAAALTHPLTVAALFTLLLNDFVLKSLWPGWVTGKLSDLAWVVFAPPLIAFALSRLIRGNVMAERGIFAVAYVGLPLLYAAFNTFEPLHEWILSGLLFLSGGAVGCPWDLTDSVVIPVGFALALWVWRESGARPANLRIRLSLYVAVVASRDAGASTSSRAHHATPEYLSAPATPPAGPNSNATDAPFDLISPSTAADPTPGVSSQSPSTTNRTRSSPRANAAPCVSDVTSTTAAAPGSPRTPATDAEISRTTPPPSPIRNTAPCPCALPIKHSFLHKSFPFGTPLKPLPAEGTPTNLPRWGAT